MGFRAAQQTLFEKESACLRRLHCKLLLLYALNELLHGFFKCMYVSLLVNKFNICCIKIGFNSSHFCPHPAWQSRRARLPPFYDSACTNSFFLHNLDCIASLWLKPSELPQYKSLLDFLNYTPRISVLNPNTTFI